MNVAALQHVIQNSNAEQTQVKQINDALEQVKNAVHATVIANVTGKNITAYGMNIYYPYSHIDSSYYKIPFARETEWLEFLRLVTD